MFNNHIKIFSTLLIVLSIAYGIDSSSSLRLSNGFKNIKIKPGSTIKLNGKEGLFTGFDVKKKAAGFIMSGSDHIKYFNLEEIKKVHLLKDGWVLTNFLNQGKVGFKKGLDIIKIISLFSVYFVYDRENNDRIEITSMEKKYITTLLVTPIIGAAIGGVWGLINPKPIYKLPISFDERTWQILF